MHTGANSKLGFNNPCAVATRLYVKLFSLVVICYLLVFPVLLTARAGFGFGLSERVISVGLGLHVDRTAHFPSLIGNERLYTVKRSHLREAARRRAGPSGIADTCVYT